MNIIYFLYTGILVMTLYSITIKHGSRDAAHAAKSLRWSVNELLARPFKGN